MLITTQQFFETLYAPYTDRGLYLELRPLHPNWRETELYPEGQAPSFWRMDKRRRAFLPLNAAHIAEKCSALNSHTHDVFMGVLPRASSRSGKLENIHQAGWLWCDIDAGDDGPTEVDALLSRAGIPSPQMIVSSGSGGRHCYWRLAEPVALVTDEDRLLLKETNIRLCRAIGGKAPGAHADKACAPASATLRVPGTLNHKRQGEPRPVELLKCELGESVRTYSSWRAILPALPCEPSPKWDRAEELGEVTDYILSLVASPAPAGAGHQGRLKLSFILASKGFSEDSVFDFLVANDRAGGRQTGMAELRSVARSACRKTINRGGNTPCQYQSL